MNLGRQLQTWVRNDLWIPWMAGLLTLVFVIYLAAFAGMSEGNRFYDLQKRQTELRTWETGLYPDIRLHKPGAIPKRAHTVYPPTSLGQLWLVSPFKSFNANAVFFLLLSAAALVVISRHAWSTVGAHGRAAGFLAMSAVWAMAGTTTCLRAGQHGLLVNALLILTSAGLLAGRPGLAGLAWAGAMVKPQMALSFLLMFVVRKQWTPAILSCLLLGAAGHAVCAFTGHTLWEVLQAAYGQAPLSYAALGDTLVQPMMTLLQISSRQAAVLSACAGMLILLPYCAGRLSRLPPLIHLAAAGVAGRLGFYHLSFDDVMVAFLLLGLLENALFKRSPVAWATFFLVGCTLWSHPVIQMYVPGIELRIALWALALVYLTHAALQRANDSASGSPKAPANGG